MNNRPVAFVDSGIGGLGYLEWVRTQLPEEHFLYISDSANFPYGRKSADEVTRAVTGTVAAVISRFQPKAFVIACNTASVVALAELRRRFDVPFVGVVPAVKPAALSSRFRRIGLFATNRTVQDTYTRDLIARFAGDCSVSFFQGSDTVTYIEERYWKEAPGDRKKYSARLAERFKKEEIDTLVLGCTHFVFLAEMLSDSLGPGIEVIDSREGVGRQVVRILTENGILNTGKSGVDRIYTTGSNGDVMKYRFFLDEYGLTAGGVLAPEQ